jgi:alanine racemase
MSRATVVHIDLAAISANIAALRARLATQKFMAVVKADAYGHGAVPCGKAYRARRGCDCGRFH